MVSQTKGVEEKKKLSVQYPVSEKKMSALYEYMMCVEMSLTLLYKNKPCEKSIS